MAGNYDSFPYPDEYLDLQDGSKGRAAYECVCAGLCSRHWQNSMFIEGLSNNYIRSVHQILQQVFDSGRHGRVCSAVRDCPEYTSEGTFDSVCDFTG